MKIRQGFVSNSSSSSYIVKAVNNQDIPITINSWLDGDGKEIVDGRSNHGKNEYFGYELESFREDDGDIEIPPHSHILISFGYCGEEYQISICSEKLVGEVQTIFVDLHN